MRYEVRYQIRGGPALAYTVDAADEAEARRIAARIHSVCEPGTRTKGKPQVFTITGQSVEE